MFKLDSSDIANKHYGSEYSQDLFALFVSNFKKSGFFVEIGMANGRSSNTYRLEKYFNWTGILIEPHPDNFNELIKASTAKRSAILVNKAVSNKLGRASLRGHGGTATLLTEYSGETDEINIVQVDTLDSILLENKAPEKINYISIDAEGSELDILSGFSFNYDTDFYSIEMKYENVVRISEIMESHGYVKVLEPFSDIDTWYVKKTIYDNLFKDWKK